MNLWRLLTHWEKERSNGVIVAQEEICSSLEQYNRHIEELKNEMDDATHSADRIRMDIKQLRSKFAFLPSFRRKQLPMIRNVYIYIHGIVAGLELLAATRSAICAATQFFRDNFIFSLASTHSMPTVCLARLLFPIPYLVVSTHHTIFLTNISHSYLSLSLSLLLFRVRSLQVMQYLGRSKQRRVVELQRLIGEQTTLQAAKPKPKLSDQSPKNADDSYMPVQLEQLKVIIIAMLLLLLPNILSLSLSLAAWQTMNDVVFSSPHNSPNAACYKYIMFYVLIYSHRRRWTTWWRRSAYIAERS